ncbi:indole-3-glycerol phosphate synthase TrpC [Anaeroselena agilis]|uniref:indole-3-glycerol-phosphate synthase n=1 Tax=Anaeroselena agilis TaxID=3063788 RepID=A0ABU3P1H8_9FIRM|nr:indole-3-glycerol phosphate synthase TrpC [Selenomonadales bacterium 4137-cl]
MLARIVAGIRQEVAARKQTRPLAELQRDTTPRPPAFAKALRAADWALIAECKLASPAKGTLTARHTVPELARIYTAGGAAALSVHTSAPFRGRLEDIAAVRAVSPLPILRKDFIIDEYQLHEARWAGADAVLLIAAILTDAELARFLAVAGELGLDTLVEVHSREELDRVQRTPAPIIGINNRDLTTFTTDIAATFALLPHTDGRRLLVSESGITGGHDARRLKQAGVRGALVGEGLVTAPDILARTRELALAGEPTDAPQPRHTKEEPNNA